LSRAIRSGSPLIMMIGRPRRLAALATSSPLPPRSTESAISRSTSPLRNAARACWRREAPLTRYPSSSSTSVRSDRRSGSSSTRRMCCAGMPTSHRLVYGCPTAFLNSRELPKDPAGMINSCRKHERRIDRFGVVADGRRPPGSGADGDALFFEKLLQFAGLEHLANDVAAADKFALNVELRDRRPAREFLDALAHRGVGQHVDAFELDPHMAEDLHHRGREAALREHRRPLHEEHDRRVGDLVADAVLYGNVHRLVLV